MNFEVEIEHWRDISGYCPVEEWFLGLPANVQGRIAKKDDYFEKYTIGEFKKTPYFEKIKGSKGFWELKYIGKGSFNYRIICVIWERKIVCLVPFEGSGSNGRVSKYMPLAIQRYERLVESSR